jgi:hypothetical protein
MVVRVQYRAVPDLLRSVLAVDVATQEGPDFRVGTVRQTKDGAWVARLRPGVAGLRVDAIGEFPSRTGAAAWLLAVGGYARLAAH